MKPGITTFLLFLLLFSVPSASAQNVTTQNIGVRAGIIIALGNRIDRIGISANAYFNQDFFQANAEFRAYYNFRNLGPRKKYFELQSALGFALGFGRTDTLTNEFTSSISNQTKYQNSFAYSYNLYFNKIKTTQQTGIVALQFQNFSLIVENDLFARPRLDRFRTGAFLLQYQYKEFQFAVNASLWTGQMGNVVHEPANDKFLNGYVDTSNSVYPEFSHGLLSAQFKYAGPYAQFAQANIGVDAEQVRNVMQNKFIHTIFRSKNADIPMLDVNGNQYLYLQGQQIKKVKFYYNAFLNPGIFY